VDIQPAHDPFPVRFDRPDTDAELARNFLIAASLRDQNEHFTLASETPHGGVKQSGWGKDGSKYALEDYTFVKHVMINSGE
jgi:acyl-CoA reductase-like NAD-dependent aldehyde dehydrogenase